LKQTGLTPNNPTSEPSENELAEPASWNIAGQENVITVFMSPSLGGLSVLRRSRAFLCVLDRERFRTWAINSNPRSFLYCSISSLPLRGDPAPPHSVFFCFSSRRAPSSMPVIA
jgi:hypothetical protein